MDRKQKEDAINEVSTPVLFSALSSLRQGPEAESFVEFKLTDLSRCPQVHVLKAMRHPYIITYKESFMDKRCLCIVMDFADGGDLYTKIAN